MLTDHVELAVATWRADHNITPDLAHAAAQTGNRRARFASSFANFAIEVRGRIMLMSSRHFGELFE